MLINFLPYREADTEADPQGGASGKVRASELRAQLGTQVDETALMRLLEKQAELLTDNSQLREQRRTLRQEVTELKSKVAPEGARILTADEAKVYDAYAALGKPDDVKKALEANSTATAELTTLKHEKHIALVAEASGFRPAVLAKLAGDLDIQVRPVKDGKPLVVVVADGAETALADYAQTNWADFLPALQAKQGSALAPDINAGARGNGQNGSTITDAERAVASRRYGATF
jgi:ABC-type amino acid transport substrate-binding protein